MRQLINEFIVEYITIRDITPKWGKRIKRMCLDFCDWMQLQGIEPEIKNLNPGLCKKYVEFLKERYHNWSRRHSYNALKLFLNYLTRKNLLSQNPLKGIRYPSAHRKLPTTLSKEEYNVVLEKIKTLHFNDPFLNLRNYLFFKLWQVSGLRVGEMVNLKISDFYLNGEKNYVQIWNSKCERFDYLPIASKLVPLIQEYLSTRGLNHSPYFFVATHHRGKLHYPAIFNLFARLKREGCLRPDITPHNIRATFCCQLLDNGVNVFEVQELMRHHSLNSTLFYVRNNPQKLQKHVDKLIE